MTTETVKSEISKEDLSRINKCNDYKYIKNVLATVEANKGFEVGTAVFVKRKATNEFVSSSYSYSTKNAPPSKYIIIKNDGGFVFAKRINQSGKPGKEVICLTIEYQDSSYELATDEDMLDAMLLDEDYDPTATAKAFAKKKNKASRMNGKNRLRFNDKLEAYKYCKGLKVGEKIWSASTTFGDYVTEYVVKEIKTRAPKSTSGSHYRYSHDRVNRMHNDNGFAVLVEVVLEQPLEKRGNYYQDTNLYFYDIVSDEDIRSHKQYYTKKPLTPQDIV